MGEARRRAQMPPQVVYHHTSTLRTNLIWMSGVIDVEGRSEGVEHPLLGQVLTDVRQRRVCVDFPALAWFTDSVRVPGCLLATKLLLQRKDGGGTLDAADLFEGDRSMFVHGLALNRMAIGFPLAGSTIIPWVDHPGFDSSEGRDLNETARVAGDNPLRWYVSDTPVDVLSATEIWTAADIFRPKLRQNRAYLPHVHQMVRLCREIPNTYIPPTWRGDPAVEQMIRMSRK